MIYVDLIISYFIWHYSLALVGLFSLSRRLFLFVVDFFSVPILISSLFSPWRRMSEKRKSGFNLGNIFSVLVVNTLMRLVGFVLRGIVLIFGVIVIIVSIIMSITAFVVWLLWPMLILGFLVYGLLLIIK